MEKALKLGYYSHKTSTCGLHFHVNRDSFGDTREIQDERISRVLYFVEHNWEELLKFSRRTEAWTKEPKLKIICDKVGLSDKLAGALFWGEYSDEE